MSHASPYTPMNYLVKCPCGHTMDVHSGEHPGCQEPGCGCLQSSMDVINALIWSVTAQPDEALPRRSNGSTAS